MFNIERHEDLFAILTLWRQSCLSFNMIIRAVFYAYFCLLIQSESAIQTTLVGTSLPNGDYTSIATSYSGQFIAVCDYEGTVYTSSDYGYYWESMGSVEEAASAMACSSSGDILVLTTNTNGIFISTNGGSDWTSVGYTGNGFLSVCASGSGQFMMTGDYDNGGVYYSSDTGSSWSIADNTADVSGWTVIACSESGQYVVATTVDSGAWASNNSGAYFTQELAVPDLYAAACSANGTLMALAQKNGAILLSTNYGGTWVDSGAPYGYPWITVAISGNGQYVAAGAFEGPVYFSSNSGGDWQATDTPINAWKFITMSYTGTYIAAVTDYQTVGGYGNVWINQMTPTSYPSSVPSRQPSSQPSLSPTLSPTAFPSLTPSFRPNSGPTSSPSSQPSTSPTAWPTSYPTYIPDTVELTSVVVSTANTSSFTFTQLGYGSAVYLSATIEVSYLTVSSTAYLLITAGSGGSVVNVSTCAPTDLCEKASCATNIDVSKAMSTAGGGSVTVTATTVGANDQVGVQSICTYKGTKNVQFVVSYVLSAYPQPTFAPTPAPTEPGSGNFIFSTSPDLPVYVIVVLTLVFATFGVFLVRAKDQSRLFEQESMLFGCLKLGLIGYYLSSELFYLVVLFSENLEYLAAIIIAMRLACLLPATHYLLITFGPPRYSVEYAKLLNKTFLFANATIFAVVLLLMLLEQSAVRFLPWHSSAFTSLSLGYPDPVIFRLSTRFKLCQLLITLIVQVVVLSQDTYVTSGGSATDRVKFALLIMYLVASAISFVVHAITSFVRINVVNSVQYDPDKVEVRNPVLSAEGRGRGTELSSLKTAESLRIQQLEEQERLLNEKVSGLEAELGQSANRMSALESRLDKLVNGVGAVQDC